MLQNFVTPAKKTSIKAKILIIWVFVSRFLFLDTEKKRDALLKQFQDLSAIA
jgi:polysaccharide deacetylase 2 family uncharacterized protein YibQ